jgi:hypothetical protein
MLLDPISIPASMIKTPDKYQISDNEKRYLLAATIPPGMGDRQCYRLSQRCYWEPIESITIYLIQNSVRPFITRSHDF